MNDQPDFDWFGQAYPDLSRMVLESNAPGCEVTPSRKGQPTLRIGGVQLHSTYDPVAEGEKLAAQALANAAGSSSIVVFGLGLGYHIEALGRLYTGRIAIVEPDPRVIACALKARESDYLKARNISLHCDTDAGRIATELERNGFDLNAAAWFVHPPSARLHPELSADLERTLNARRNHSLKGLRILVNTPIYGGSLPVARYCASAFERLGHHVETLDNEIYAAARERIEGLTGNKGHRAQLGALLNTLLAESITALALDRSIDLVFSLAQSPMTPDVARELKRQGIPVAFWFVEDWKLFSYWRDWALLYDYFFTIQKGQFPEELARLGVQRTRYLPLAADPQVHRPLKLSPAEQAEYGSAVSHLGAGYRNRRQVFSGLTDLDFKVWGNDWQLDTSLGRLVQRDGARLSTEDTVKVFNATQINLNLHSSAFHDGVDAEGDFVNPRTFEVAACGAFQLVDRRALLPELFRTATDDSGRDLEMAEFDHESQLRGLINHYLAHPEERQRIAENGRRRVLTDHTYEQRMADALEFIYSHEDKPASRRRPDHIDNLISDAAEDPELKAFLETFRERGVVTLDDIVDEIKKGQGDLSQTEAIFLLMFEFRKWAREKDLV